MTIPAWVVSPVLALGQDTAGSLGPSATDGLGRSILIGYSRDHAVGRHEKSRGHNNVTETSTGVLLALIVQLFS